jgi:hypothetical protein
MEAPLHFLAFYFKAQAALPFAYRESPCSIRAAGVILEPGQWSLCRTNMWARLQRKLAWQQQQRVSSLLSNVFLPFAPLVLPVHRNLIFIVLFDFFIVMFPSRRVFDWYFAGIACDD